MSRTGAGRSRRSTYLLLRCLALGMLLLAVVVPPGIGAALLFVAGGLLAVLTSFGTNAGGPGEQAGARPQDRHFDRLMPPQGDWPPYDPAGSRQDP